MPRATAAEAARQRMTRLGEALEELRSWVGDRNRRHPGEGQAGANELAWAAARHEAAVACVEWAEAKTDPLAMMVADAVIDEANEAINGEAATNRITAQERLAAIAESYRPLEALGASDEHRLLRSTCREFAQREIGPYAQAIHRGDLDLPESIIRGVAELGLFGISVPAEYGGSRGKDPDYEAMLIVTEELSRASLAAGGSLITRPEILIGALLAGGTEEQKQTWLPVIASGEKMVAVAVTEPDYGSDVASVKCRAQRTTDGWRVNGTKLWCTFAGRAELLMLLCRTGENGHRGLSLFVAEKPAFAGHSFEFVQPGGGILRGRAIPTIGYRGMHSFELVFEDFFLPLSALVGGDEWLNRGFYLQMGGFSVGRLQTAGRAVGVMDAALEDSLKYATERHVFGRAIAHHQLPAVMLGRMATRLTAARQLGYRAARRLRHGADQPEASLAKLYSSKMAESVTRDAMQVFGGMGYAEETNVSRYFLDARVLTIFEGTEEVLALRVISRTLMAR